MTAIWMRGIVSCIYVFLSALSMPSTDALAGQNYLLIAALYHELREWVYDT